MGVFENLLLLTKTIASDKTALPCWSPMMRVDPLVTRKRNIDRKTDRSKGGKRKVTSVKHTGLLSAAGSPKECKYVMAHSYTLVHIEAYVSASLHLSLPIVFNAHLTD